MKDIFLRSGKWRWSAADQGSGAETLELIDPANPQNKMRARLPFTWQELSNDAIEEIAREPEMRLWMDEYGVTWRIARVGPGTHYPYSLRQTHLVFDSEEAYAGIVALDEHARLGDLTAEELRRYRDRMRDFGGRRQYFRPPLKH